jgi:hypothetical protein
VSEIRFDATGAPEGAIDPGPQVGDIYNAKGGGRCASGDTIVFWVVMSSWGDRVHLAGLSRDGRMLTTTSYGRHVLDDRRRLGRCPEIAALARVPLHIEWFP